MYTAVACVCVCCFEVITQQFEGSCRTILESSLTVNKPSEGNCATDLFPSFKMEAGNTRGNSPAPKGSRCVVAGSWRDE